MGKVLVVRKNGDVCESLQRADVSVRVELCFLTEEARVRMASQ